MSDLTTVADLSTAAGTLVLAVATFSSVRASQRSARIAEQALLVGLRPVLAPTQEDDPAMTVSFGDQHVVTVAGGGAALDLEDGRFYFVVPLRNVGPGLAVLHAWRVSPRSSASSDRPPLGSLRRQQRDLYIPAGGIGFWQAALRDADDEMRAGIDDAYAAEQSLAVDLLYGDYEGGQRTITRFSLFPNDGRWLAGVVRHWRLDGADPRDAPGAG
jgi:hypothetical protein